jgi:DNA-binding NarL/FixJ family response regulator
MDVHRRQLGKRLGMRSVAEMAEYAIRHGLASADR